MKYTQWAFTVKYVATLKPDELLDTMYSNWFYHLEQHGIVFRVKKQELDPKFLWHWHGVMSVPSNVLLRKLKVYGYSPMYKRLYNAAGWIDYINKQAKAFDDIPEGDSEDEVPRGDTPPIVCPHRLFKTKIQLDS